MRSNSDQDGHKKRSFIEQARRAQIITAAIETMAEHGYANTSLARIAERADISKGVISYHFAGKDELMGQVVDKVFSGILEEVAPRIAAQPGPREALRTHILLVGEYMRGHRTQLVALAEIFNGARTPEGAPKYGVAASEPLFEAVEIYFTEGQRIGVFRHFGCRAMAVTLQSSLDGALGYWVAHPDHDLETHLLELAEALDRAVVADTL